ncbi:hypothetical protein [Nocardia brasiliensis]|uniref:hypothetical protein n=1 Tax=Nocardia brasiliensis TaxID=37326 RepID=UPI002453BB6D|nr:hypothetical protein [Nocardia brasiliensis]
MNSPAGTQFTPPEPEAAPSPITAAVEAGRTLKDKILGVCEILEDPDVQTQQILDILAAHGHEPSREHVQKTIAPWRKRRRAAEAAEVAAAAAHTAEVAAVHTAESEDFTPEFTPPAVRLTSNDVDRNATTADMPVFTPDMEREFEKDFAALQEAMRETVSAGVNNGRHAVHTVNGTTLHTRAGVADRPWQEFTPPVDAHPVSVHTLPPVAPLEFTPLDSGVHTSAGAGDASEPEATLPDLPLASRVHTPGPATVAPRNAAEAEDSAGQPIADDLERELRALQMAGRTGGGEAEPYEPHASAGAAEQETPRRSSPAGEYLFYLAAAVPMITSLDTSWKLFERLGVNNTVEQVAMFAGLELGFIACAVHMGLTIRKRKQEPSMFVRLVLWALCGISVYGAVVGAGLELGLARVLFGPAISMMMLHLALMAERRAHGAQKDGTLAKIGREIRERFLSRFGLGNDERDAAQRIKDRNSQLAAKLGAATFVLFRRTRLRRAMRRAGLAHDPVMLQRMLAEFDFEKHVDALRTLDRPSPFDVLAGQDRTPADAHR